MEESRSKNVQKNILWGNVSSITSLILSVISRSFFISYLGMEYLGVNGLFTNILGLLSFSELGIGTAMNYSLYKPIADNDTEKIKSLLQLYKKAYRIIATVISMVGIAIMPFLPKLVTDAHQYGDLYIYYIIFLFNTVSSYFVTYKYSYISALQKEYIITNVNTIITFSIQACQIIIIVITRNFLAYLLVQSVLLLVQKIITVFYINKKFPILTDQDCQKLDEKTKKRIFSDVKALIVHKIGDASVHQTDNIIISVFVNTTTVGLVSNYIMIQSAVSRFTGIVFNSFTAGFGNLIAKDNKKKQEWVFNQYNFLGFWIFGFVTVAFISLSQPLMTLWGEMVGKNMLIDSVTMVLYFITIYLGGQSLTLYNFKVAAGIFNDDKWVALVQAIVNLIVSIGAIKIMGLPGVYFGTIVQRMVAIIWKPIIVYRKQFDKSALGYFVKFFRYLISTTLACIINCALLNILFSHVTIYNFFIMCVITAIVPNAIFLLLHVRDIEFKELLMRLKVIK